MFSLNGLCFGDYPQLAERMLSSWKYAIDHSPHLVHHVQIGLNSVSRATTDLATQWASRVSAKHPIVPVVLVRAEKAGPKYPFQRRMLKASLAYPWSWAVWFDDDSFFLRADSLDVLSRQCRSNEAVGRVGVIGEIWQRALKGNQLAYYQSRPWWHRDLKVGPRSKIKFPTGGFHVYRREFLDTTDWPIPELVHHGGDQLLALYAPQCGWGVAGTTRDSVARVNAKIDGGPSSMPSREELVGSSKDWLGLRWDLKTPYPLQPPPEAVVETWRRGSPDVSVTPAALSPPPRRLSGF